MRVGILTQGTRGDVQPFLALAQQLHAKGHEVAICCPCSSAGMVREHGFEAHAMTFDAEKVVKSVRMQRAMETGDGNACIVAFFESQKEQKEEGADSAEQASAFVKAYRPDILVGHPSMVSFIIIAERYGLPVINAMFMPLLPSRSALPAFKTTVQLASEGILDNPLEAHRQMFMAFLGEADLAELNSLRERWNMKVYTSVAELHAAFQAIPYANCWSPAVIPEPSDLAAEFPLAQQTGYLFADPPPGYTPPMELQAFLDEPGVEKPIYVGFGSLSAGDPRIVTEKILWALILAGNLRCVIAGGWSGIGPEHLDPDLTERYTELKKFADAHVLKVATVPHSWLLPLCFGAVHHGGAGTTAAVARAGVPTIIAPFAWDQPWWAEQMQRLGVGIALPTMITKISAEKLGSAMARLAEDKTMAARAAKLGAAICSEPAGAERLVECLETVLSAPFAWPTATQPMPSAPPPPLWNRATPGPGCPKSGKVQASARKAGQTSVAKVAEAGA
mmetsp:Transcript_131596/g.281379  ORF Transcript_131596/g.281379 Transcript_131596/m.281379 type:complete len:505 (+) Transcript_131596:76-1590(+)